MAVSTRVQQSIFVILALLGVTSVVTLFGALSTRDAAEPTWLTQAAGTTPTMTTGTTAIIPVYLVGEVRCPGIYHVKRGTFLYEVVEQAGGLTPDAAADRTNLVYQIDSSQLLRIPSIEEGAGAGDAFDAAGLPAASASQININTADEAELDTLPGIGPTTARAIVSFRTQHGPFGTIEEIMNVPGIKQSRFEAIRDAITT